MHYKWYICFAVLLCSCQSPLKKEKGPDISKVKLDMTIDRFEKSFFALDTNHLDQGLIALKKRYGVFYDNFLYSIATFSPKNEDLNKGISQFIRTNKTLSDQIDRYFPDLDRDLKPIENALKRAKVYFPAKKIPDRLITYIGPLDSYGIFIDKNSIAIGLQQFLGIQYPGYQSEYMENLFGKQRLKCFSKEYIPVAAIAAWISYAFPRKSGIIRLKDKMMEDGRALYAVKKLLPEVPDTLLFGYSKKQLDWCNGHKSEIYDYFEKGKLFETKDPELIFEYTSDQMTAEGLPKECPYNIGKYIGFTLIKRYMGDNQKDSISKLFD